VRCVVPISPGQPMERRFFGSKIGRTARGILLAMGVGTAAVVAGVWWHGWGSPTGPDAQARPAPSPPPLENANRSHPLYPALELARRIEQRISSQIHDYRATLVKRERIGSEIREEHLQVKIRHEPFSVYVCRLDAQGQPGDEGIFVDGRNDNKLIGYTKSFPGRLLGTVAIDPRGSIAMTNQHYPITEIGILNLSRRIIEIVQEDMAHEECQVAFHETELNGRPVTCVEVVHPQRRPYFRFHLGRVYLDRQLDVPLRYEAYDWPTESGGQPELIEQYTYRDLELNVGLSDRDFDPKNPEYHFP